MSTLKASLNSEWSAPFLEGKTFGQYIALLGAYAAVPMTIPGYIQDLRALWGLRVASGAVARALTDSGTPEGKLSAALDEIDGVRAALAEAKSLRETAGDTADAMLEQVNAIRIGDMKPGGATTGYVDLDRIMLGYRPGELVVVGARPGIGKTTFGTSSLLMTAKAGHGVQFFSLELPREGIAARILSDIAYDWRHPLSHSQIRRGEALSDDQYRQVQDAARVLRDMPFEFDYAPRLSVADVGVRVAAARERMAAKGRTLQVVGIDYLKFLKATDRYRGQRTYEVGDITAGLKEVAKDQEVCIVLLAQLNRGIEAERDKRPDLHHLRESGDIEADADVVMFLYREAYYIEKSAEFKAGDLDSLSRHDAVRNKLEIIVAKNRNGPTTSAKLFCDIGASAVRNASHDYYGDR